MGEEWASRMGNASQQQGEFAAVFGRSIRPDALVKLGPVQLGGGSGGVAVAAVGMVGQRPEYEDEHLVEELPIQGHLLLGIFDGHNGHHSAQYAKTNLARILQQTVEWKAYSAEEPRSAATLGAALTQAFIALDRELKTVYLTSGTTATVVVVTPRMLVCANAGDSRTVLGQVDGTAIALSVDHKPNLPGERARIEAAGGTVVADETDHGAGAGAGSGFGIDLVWRINGQAACSRGFGDFDLKGGEGLGPGEQQVSCVPDVTIHRRDDDRDDFLLLASKGLFDVLTQGDALAHARRVVGDEYAEPSLLLACEELLDLAFSRRSLDNISAVLVRLPAARLGLGEGGGVARLRRERGDLLRLVGPGDDDGEYYDVAPTCDATPQPGSLFFGLDE